MSKADQFLQAKIQELDELLERSKKNIAAARVKRAISELLAYDEQIDPNLQLIQFSQQWEDVSNQDSLGLLSYDKATGRKNNIVYGLLKFINRVHEEYVEEKQLVIKDEPSMPDLPMGISVEKITGNKSNLYAMNWFGKMLQAARSVCRIVTKETIDGQIKTFFGTGFLIEGGILLTNHHVLHSKEAVEGSIAEFGYMGEEAKASYRLDVDSWVSDDEDGLDVARVSLIDDQDIPLSNWGHLTLNSEFRVHSGSTRLNIIQHPKGEPMQVAFTENEAVRVTDALIDYKTDTKKGSSGSPVFNQEWEVVGLHRGAQNDRDVNAGSPIKAILDFFENASSPAGDGPASTERAAEETGQVATSPAAPDDDRFKVLLVYAMEDQSAREDLDKHLFLLRRDQRLQFLDMHQDVPPGTADEYAAQEALIESADIVVCLISHNILSYPAYPLAEKAAGAKKLIPLRLHEIDLAGTVFEPIKGLPSDNRFLSEWTNPNSAFVDIAKNLRTFLLKKLA